MPVDQSQATLAEYDAGKFRVGHFYYGVSRHKKKDFPVFVYIDTYMFLGVLTADTCRTAGECRAEGFCFARVSTSKNGIQPTDHKVLVRKLEDAESNYLTFDEVREYRVPGGTPN